MRWVGRLLEDNNGTYTGSIVRLARIYKPRMNTGIQLDIYFSDATTYFDIASNMQVKGTTI
jgi:hypothetical protein